MEVYINGMGNVSPQETLDRDKFLESPVSYSQPWIKSIAPAYKEYIAPRAARRMGTLLRNGVVAAKAALKDAGIEEPEAIITGTGLGCVENTDKFLFALIENDEQLLNPTPFIQSTHNTVGGLIALMLKCNGYNFTYSHSGFSFESALLDAWLQVKGNELDHMLIGSIDEVTEFYHTLTQRLGFWKTEEIDSIDLLKSTSSGSIAGEGSIFYVLSPQKTDSTYARLIGLDTCYKPSGFGVIQNKIKDFLDRLNVEPESIDLIVLGNSGDGDHDKFYDQVTEQIFPDAIAAGFKHLVGDYQTAASFGMWLGTRILESGKVPTAVLMDPKKRSDKEIKRVLVYNHYRKINHSFILLESIH